MKKLLLGALLLGGMSLGYAKDVLPTQNSSQGIEKTITQNKIVKTIRFDSKEEALKFIQETCTDVYIDIEYIGSDEEYDYYDVTITVIQYEC